MWLIFAILNALMAAISITLTKAGLKNVHPVLAFALESILILTISWSTVFFIGAGSEIGKIDKKAWLFLACAGVATTLASLFQFRALKEGPAGAVASIDRSSLVLTILFATLFLKEKLNWQLVIGGILIVGGAILIATGKQEGN